MGREHHLNGIRDQFPGAEGIFHPQVVHGQAVAHTDGIEGKGDAARAADPRLHCLYNGIEMGVAGYVIAFGADHGHKGAGDFPVGQAQGLEKGPVGRPSKPRTSSNHCA